MFSKMILNPTLLLANCYLLSLLCKSIPVCVLSCTLYKVLSHNNMSYDVVIGLFDDIYPYCEVIDVSFLFSVAHVTYICSDKEQGF